MKKEVKKSAKKNRDMNYKRALIFIMIVLIIIIISLFIFIKSNKNEEGLPSLGVGNINVLAYNTDPLGLADYSHIIFIDQNNINCNDSYTRLQAMNPNTPWCDSSVFGSYAVTSPIKAGDKILFKNGTYYGEIYVGNIGKSSTNYTIFEPYPGESVTLLFGKQFSSWTGLGNGVYTKTLDELDTGGYIISSTLRAIPSEGYAITRVGSLNDLYNPNVTSPVNASDYDFFFVNATTKQVFLRLVNVTPENIYFSSSYLRFEIDYNSSYIEIKGFNIIYCYDGIKYSSPHIRLINNTIKYIDDNGIIGGGYDVLIEGNDVSYVGEPLRYEHETSSNLIIPSNQAHAMYLGGDGVIIKNNNMTKCHETCMHPWSGNPPYPSNFTISGNIMDGFVTSGNNFDVYNNIVYNYFNLYPASSDIKVHNNLFIGTFIIPYLSTNLSNLNLNNNIIAGLVKDQYCLMMAQVNYSSLFMDNNIYYNCNYFRVNYINDTYPGYVFDNFKDYKTFMNSNLSLENDSFSEDPLLNGTSGLLFGSPAIDNGTCFNGINSDFYGNSRPLGKSCDIGPFEFNNTLCGDTVCDSYENCTTCSLDCGNCPCGNGVCDISESCSNCPTDCGSCVNNNDGSNGDSGGNGDNSKTNHNNSLKNNTNVILSVDQSTLNQSGNETIEFEKPENVVNYLVYFLMTLCFIFLIIIIILLIVRYYKNKGNKRILM